MDDSSKLGFPGGSEVKASACNVGDLGSIPGSGTSPGEGNGKPLQYSFLENPIERSLVGYSPRGRKRVGHDPAIKQQQSQQIHFSNQLFTSLWIYGHLFNSLGYNLLLLLFFFLLLTLF